MQKLILTPRLKPCTLQGNRRIRERPITFAVSLLHPELWRRYVRACIKENRQ